MRSPELFFRTADALMNMQLQPEFSPNAALHLM